ncbi:MAG: cobyrinate a,c-diamide synthase [Desulfovibrio sp.]|nr:cobyrinate a,c-diamide synthase [Desulfovibrio sp.]
MIPGFIIAANATGAGKTSVAIALIRALRERGLRVAAAKLGPDFIDAAWLSWAAGLPSVNLDCRMASVAGLKRILRRLEHDLKPDILVCESAMGLYDGDRRGKGSAAELAVRLEMPALLLLDAKGLGGSVAPLADGFLGFEAPWHTSLGKPRFCGLLCSKVSGARHADLLENSLRPVLQKYNIPLAGFLPQADAPRLSSRHLGLRQASEEAPSLDVARLGKWAEENCDLDDLLRRLGVRVGQKQTPAPVAAPPFCKKKSPESPVVAVARDEAFAFCYADLPALLEELGCRVAFFSPLDDVSLPECDGVYIPGGYPELYASRLSRNLSMIASIRARAARGMPLYAECGGYIYISQSLRDPDGVRWPMAGLAPGERLMEKRLQALGYRFVRGADSLGQVAAAGHEFHYGRDALAVEPSLWEVRDSQGKRLSSQGYQKDNIMASWIHLYPEGSRKFWKYWTNKVREFRKARLNARG